MTADKRTADRVEELLASYRRYLLLERELDPTTVVGYVHRVRPFLVARVTADGLDLAGLTAADVNAFVLADCVGRDCPRTPGRTNGPSDWEWRGSSPATCRRSTRRPRCHRRACSPLAGSALPLPVPLRKSGGGGGAHAGLLQQAQRGTGGARRSSER
jgi:hypothetical protein